MTQTSPDDRIWWAIGADCIASGGFVLEAPTRRQALASLRHKLIDAEVSTGDSRRRATEWVRHIDRWVEAGPMTTAEAAEYELGWALAAAVCRQMETTTMCDPQGPLRDRDVAVRWLGEDLVRQIERRVAQEFEVRELAAG